MKGFAACVIFPQRSRHGDHERPHNALTRRGRVGKGVRHLDHVSRCDVRKVVSSIPDRGNIVG